MRTPRERPCIIETGARTPSRTRYNGARRGVACEGHHMDEQRFQPAIRRIDDANRQDPRRTRVLELDVPDELLYSERMTTRLLLLEPGATEALQLAARCQH